MKKLTLFALILSMTFGVFAQRQVILPKQEKQTPKMEINKAVKGMIPANVISTSSKHSMVKEVGCTMSNFTSVEDWANGGITVSFDVALNSDTKAYFLNAGIADSVAEWYPTDQDFIDAVVSFVNYYKELYAQFGMEVSDSMFYEFEGGTQELNGMAANTEYTIIAMCMNETDTVVVRENYTTPATALTGDASMTNLTVDGVTSTNALLTVEKNDQTAYYCVLFASESVFQANNLTDAASVAAYVAANSSQMNKFTQDTTWELGDDDLSSQYALDPNTKYIVWVIAFNGNSVAGTPQSVEFTTESSQMAGTAGFVDMNSTVLSETNAEVEFKINDQTAYYYYFLDNRDTLLAYDQYEEEGALEWMNYLINYYAQNGYAYPSNSSDTTVELGDDDATSQYALEAGTAYVVWGFPYNGNKELGVAKRIEFTTQQVGLKDIDFTAVNVYPNPTTDVVMVNSKNAIENIEIVNTLGQVVYSNNTNQNNVTINVANLEKGNYFVKVKTIDNVTTTSKVVVK